MDNKLLLTIGMIILGLILTYSLFGIIGIIVIVILGMWSVSFIAGWKYQDKKENNKKD